MSIVCATNFSDAALRASTLAAALARKSGVPLLLVHVLNPNSARAFGRALTGAAEAALADQVKRLEKQGAKVETTLLTGEPAESLVAFAREQQASLVMVAAPSQEAPFLSVGGTVDRLAQALPIPLLVVRGAASLEAWARGERPLKVMLGVDRSLPFEAAREWVKGLRRFGAVEVVGGRVYWPEEEYPRLGLPLPNSFDDVTPELRQAMEQETAALLAPLASDAQAPRAVVFAGVGRIADHLVELAEREGVDLLVVGTHHRRALGRLWSVSHHAVRLARMSVACVPSTMAAEAAVDAPLPVFSEVLVGTDFSETGNRAVAYACGLVPEGGTVHLVHAAEGKLTPGQEAELKQQLLAAVPKAAQAGGRRVQVELLPHGRDVVMALVQASERHRVDAIVMGTHGRSGLKRAVLGSVTQELLLRTDRPVLVVRPPRG
ncbi:universal stress protein [Pyxidicoccus parkwayensis]|uniref:Universal stress protein n=1 Tax=Pyxidicoccus parkwayensis TaxID=2813578 RepID=A0ABX7NSP7_9BACT|nr:universal stress protein [Pyxidicoccus parkwaysis]QSQ21897.1 universal stress protein [Pyxidicoccus parkwaysis]